MSQVLEMENPSSATTRANLAWIIQLLRRCRQALSGTQSVKVACTVLVTIGFFYLMNIHQFLPREGIPFHSGTGINSEISQVVQNSTSLEEIARRGYDNLFPKKGIVMKIPKCNCSKLIPHPRKYDDGKNDFHARPIKLKDTMCEGNIFVRGAGQNIVAFTFYEPPINVSFKL